MRRFTKDHEWVILDGDVATIGISNHATSLLGDIVYVDVPEVGTKFRSGAAMAVVESVKAASDVYAPVAGEILEINQILVDDPELVNRDPEEAGWFVKMRVDDIAQFEALMSTEQYLEMIV